jgi:hypothetical protein
MPVYNYGCPTSHKQLQCSADVKMVLLSTDIKKNILPAKVAGASDRDILFSAGK